MSKFYDVDLEQSLLLACIENNDNIDLAANIIRPNDFSYPLHGNIFDFLVNKRRLKESVDLKQVKLSFPNATDNFWTSLSQQNSFIDVDSYAKSLRDLSIKDNLYSLMKTTSTELVDVLDSIEYTHELNAKIYNLVSGVSDNSLKSSKTAISEYFEELNRIAKLINKDIIGVDTGYSLLNYHTKGFKAGELIILGARPGMGKTTLALNILLHAIKNNVGVAFYSLETEAFKVMAKLIAQDTGLPLQSVISGTNLTSSEFDDIQNCANMLSEKTLYIYDKGSLTIEFLRSSLRRLKEEHPNIELCIVDYLQLMSSNLRADRHVQVSEISRGLKLLALELKIAILALSQVNRQVDSRSGEKRKLMLSDLRESGSIEQDADLVLFINNSDDEDVTAERKVTLDIAKNRSGGFAEIHFNFEASKARFSQIDFSSTNTQAPVQTEEL